MQSKLSVAPFPVVRFNADGDKNLPARIIPMPGIDDSWVKKNVTFDDVFNNSEVDAAVAYLRGQFAEIVKRQFDRDATDAQVSKALKSTTIHVVERELDVISLTQFRSENPQFEALKDAQLEAMIAALKPGTLIVK